MIARRENVNEKQKGEVSMKGKLEAFLEMLKSDPEIMEKIRSMGPVKSEEEKIKVLSGIAREKGVELTAEDLKEYLAGKKTEQNDRTEAGIAQLEDMPDEELAAAAGGAPKEHDNCVDTYRDKENCWLTDGCDAVFERYDGYECSLTQHVCPNNMVDNLPSIITLFLG